MAVFVVIGSHNFKRAALTVSTSRDFYGLNFSTLGRSNRGDIKFPELQLGFNTK
ncbi:hypothetical protein D3C83_278030 [compost metagenome]